jgi:acetyl esterase/lipase
MLRDQAAAILAMTARSILRICAGDLENSLRFLSHDRAHEGRTPSHNNKEFVEMPISSEANASTPRRCSSVLRLLATGALTLLAGGIIAGCAATAPAAPAATAAPKTEATTVIAAEPGVTPAAAATASTAPQARGGPGGMAQIKATPSFADLAYASASPTQKLDLYLPEGAGPFPLIVHVHGGGFMMGDKSNPPGADEFLANGYAVASVDYRLSGEALAPAQIQDIKAAVRFLRANADQYKLNPDKFAGFGGSAGGSLVALLGTSCGAAALEGAELGNADQSSCVQAVVDWFGPTDFLQMDKQFAGTSCPANHDQADSPESKLVGAPIQTVPDKVKLVNAITYVSPKAPPFLIQHGTADCNVPPQQGQLLYDALKPAIGADNVTLTFLEGAGHGGAQFSDAANMELVLDFLAKHLKG